MPRWLLGLLFVFGLGCQQAARYGSDWAEPKEKADTKVETKVVPAPAHYGWLEPDSRWDRPIVFVTADNKEWQHLHEFWNERPGLSTALLSPVPLGSVGALSVAFEIGNLAYGLQTEPVKIKVPLGLPDPTPYIPASNPPTLAKWRLGRKLFFDKQLLPITIRESQSCADCHDPKQGFTQWGLTRPNARFNTLSLLNVVYNKQQFWDGRGAALEQVIQRQLSDEDAPLELLYEQKKHPEYRHSWGGVISRLSGRKDSLLEEFKEVFGTYPTIDNVGKALATYLRTLLSGASLYDRAEQTRQQEKTPAAELLARHFAPHLYPNELEKLGRTNKKVEEVAQELELGRRLFVKSGCLRCHAGPLFTDQDYHNIGVGDSFWERRLTGDVGTGRFNVLPLGLKDGRYVGAYRTPTLRNLPRTKPYMHDGSQDSLEEVLAYYNNGLPHLTEKLVLNGGRNVYLDPLLRASAEEAQRLNLNETELRAVELFLRALDGREIPERIQAKP